VLRIIDKGFEYIIHLMCKINRSTQTVAITTSAELDSPYHNIVGEKHKNFDRHEKREHA
jgi:hypothetical protein